MKGTVSLTAEIVTTLLSPPVEGMNVNLLAFLDVPSFHRAVMSGD